MTRRTAIALVLFVGWSSASSVELHGAPDGKDVWPAKEWPTAAAEDVGLDGDQLRGDSIAQAREAVNAAVRDASAEISEDRVPRQYHKVMRKYFDRLANLADRQLAGKKDNKPAGDSDK